MPLAARYAPGPHTRTTLLDYLSLAMCNLKNLVPAVYPAGPLPMMIVSRTSFFSSAVEPEPDDVDIGAPALPTGRTQVLRLRLDRTNGGSWHDAAVLALRCCDDASSRDLLRIGAGPTNALDNSVRLSIVVNQQLRGRLDASFALCAGTAMSAAEPKNGPEEPSASPSKT